MTVKYNLKVYLIHFRKSSENKNKNEVISNQDEILSNDVKFVHCRSVNTKSSKL